MESVNLRDQLGYTDDDYHRMQQAMQDNAGIQLPFLHMQAWAANGQRNARPMAQTSPVSYYGGWNINADSLEEMQQSGELTVMIDQTGWTKSTKSGRDNKDYSVYETRVLHLAPIGRRMSWITKDGKSRMPDYSPEHSRSHLQILCLVGCTVDTGSGKGIHCVGPGVISVKGKGQTEALNAAFAAWKRSIDSLRPAMNAKGLPLFSWWMTIGTRGEAEFESIGQGNTKSDITPLRALMADGKLELAHMAPRFIGKPNFDYALTLLDQSQEWLAAWKQPAQMQAGAAEPTNGNGGGGGYTEPPYQGAAEEEDDIPFIRAWDSPINGRRVL